MKIRFCFISILALFFSAKADAAGAVVQDGDSLIIGERRIRLDGIDAPEFTQTCFDGQNKEYDCGKKSLHYLENLIANAEIKCSCLSEKDRYKREICECFAGNVSLNKKMVAAGWAVTYRDKTYLLAEQEAKQNKRGIWQGKFMRPAIYRILHKAEQKSKNSL